MTMERVDDGTLPLFLDSASLNAILYDDKIAHLRNLQDAFNADPKAFVRSTSRTAQHSATLTVLCTARLVIQTCSAAPSPTLFIDTPTEARGQRDRDRIKTGTSAAWSSKDSIRRAVEDVDVAAQLDCVPASAGDSIVEAIAGLSSVDFEKPIEIIKALGANGDTDEILADLMTRARKGEQITVLARVESTTTAPVPPPPTSISPDASHCSCSATDMLCLLCTVWGRWVCIVGDRLCKIGVHDGGTN